MAVTKTYTVNQIKQLIELNENKTNFSLTFDVKSKDGSPFKVLVISEADLNSGKPLNYQDVKDGYISGKVENDKGVFQTYFLLLKSDNPTECDVTIDIKEIPINPEIQKQEMMYRRMEQEKENQQKKQMLQMQNMPDRESETKSKRRIIPKADFKKEGHKKGTNWLLIGGIILLCAVGAWLFFSKRKVNKQPVNKSLTTQIESTPKMSIENFLEDNSAVVHELPIKLPQPAPPIVQQAPVTQTLYNNIPQETISTMNVPSLSVPSQSLPVSNPVQIPVPAQLPVIENNLSMPRVDSGRRNVKILNKLDDYFKNI